jgi:aspartokinase
MLDTEKFIKSTSNLILIARNASNSKTVRETLKECTKLLESLPKANGESEQIYFSFMDQLNQIRSMGKITTKSREILLCVYEQLESINLLQNLQKQH